MMSQQPVDGRQTITLSRGAGWHGIKDGIEGNYISTGDDLVLADTGGSRDPRRDDTPTRPLVGD